MGDEQVSGTFEMWLLDASGSMQGKRFDLLRAAVKQFKATAPHVKLVTFATEITVIDSLDTLDGIHPDGGTNLHLALEHAAGEMCGRVIVFTDGEPADEDACFVAASNVPGIVSTIFCGDEHDRDAIRFCDKLSRDNGGQFVARDVLKNESLLCGEVRNVLALPSSLAL
jgi:uncharacterized protein YegL